MVRGAQFIHADHDGTLDLASSRDTLCTLLSEEAGESNQKFDLLFDVRDAEIDLTMSDVWTLVQDIEQCAPGFDERLALLDDWDQTFDRMQFMEASAHEVGFQVRAFIDFESAVDWLWESHSVSAPLDDADE
jgi:hypothetical protein